MLTLRVVQPDTNRHCSQNHIVADHAILADPLAAYGGNTAGKCSLAFNNAPASTS